MAMGYVDILHNYMHFKKM